jgi:hypothetical protein
MKVFLCCLVSVIAIFTLVIGVYQAPSLEFTPARRCSELPDELARALLRAEELDALRASVLGRIAGQKQIVHDLAARRLTFLEAAARCRDLYRSQPESEWRLLRRFYPGDSDAERFCWCVIRCAQNYLPEGDRRDALVASLERELQDHLQKGNLHLP